MSARDVAGTGAWRDGWRRVLWAAFALTLATSPAWPARPSSKDLGIAAQETEEAPVSRPRRMAGSQTAASAPATQPDTPSASQPASRPASQPTTAPGSQPREPDITPAMVEAARTRVQASQDLPDADKKQILEIYDQALGLIKVADDWQKQIDKYQQDIDQIQAKLDAANAKLAQPVEDLTPRVPAEATVAEIDKRRRAADELDRAARLDASSLVRDQQACQDRKQEIKNRRATIREQTTQIAEELSSRTTANTELEQAQRIRLQTRRRALWREYTALDKQRQYDDARQPLLTVQIDLANRYQQATAQALEAWGRIREEQNAAELERSAAQARQQRLARRQDRPEIRDIAQQNEQLTQERLDLRRTVASLQDIPSQDETSRMRRSVSDDHHNMEQRIKTAGLTEGISSLLRRQRAQLPDVLQHQRNRRRLEAEISRAQLCLIDLEDQRFALANMDQQVKQIMRGLNRSVSQQDRDGIRNQLDELLRTKRKHLDNLIQDYNATTQTWFEIEAEERLLIDATRKYADFIDEHVLWVRSTRPIHVSYARHAWDALCWLTDLTNWKDVGASLAVDLQTNPLTVLVSAALLAGLVAGRRQLRLRMRMLDEMASKGRTYAFRQTLEAMGLTLLLAAPWPGIMWFAGWRLSTAVTAGELAGAIAAGLRSAAGLFLLLEIVRQVCRKRGLGQTHLHWPAESMQLLRKNLAWAIPVAVPLTFIVSAIEWQASTDYKDSLGRLAFMAGTIVLAMLAKQVLHPRAALVAGYLQKHADGWIERLRYLWYPAAVGIPAGLAIAAAMGYFYTAMQMTSRLLATVALVFGVLVVKALLLRLLFVARRRLAIETARKRVAADEAQPLQPVAVVEGRLATISDNPAGVSAVVPPEPEVDLAAIDAQTRQLVRIGVLVALVLGLWGIWVDVLPALGILDRVTLWTTTLDSAPGDLTGGKYAITLGGACLAVLILLMAVAAARNIPGLLEITFLRLMPLEAGARYAINAISRYIVIIVGLMIACGKIGIGWSKVQWLAAAVTVGLGFGLQEIFANFISGIIILFERPIRVGDIVTVRDTSGTVSKIRIRATTIVSWDRKELIVPNKEFITGQVMNWTLSDPILRMTISVGVAHGADADEVQQILLRVARENCHVLETPKPTAFFTGLQDNSLRFQLRVFVSGPEQTMTVQHELAKAINTALCKADIEGAFVLGQA